MSLEIERKFLVTGDFSRQVTSAQRIVQGYICSQPGRTVRVRIRGEEGFLTIKGASDEKGLSRYEFEQKIPLADAEELLKLCEPGAIDKVRNLVPAGKHTWEVDVSTATTRGWSWPKSNWNPRTSLLDGRNGSDRRLAETAVTTIRC